MPSDTRRTIDARSESGQRDRSRRDDDGIRVEVDDPGTSAGRTREPAVATDDRLRDLEETRRVAGRNDACDALVDHERAAVDEHDRAYLAVGPARVEDDTLVGDVAESADRGASTRGASAYAPHLDECRMVGLRGGR